jgi:hypothetical protein
MRARLSVAMTLALICALAAAPTAGAAQAKQAPMKQVVAVSGATKSGKSFAGTYAIDRFKRASSGKLVAVGTLRGKLAGQQVTRRNLTMPARLAKATSSAQLPPIPNACQVLNLVLGPINLNLLGLVIRTNQINLRIDAVPGAGNLLGNLLCAITGLLDPQAASTREEATALNSILALVGRR